MLSASRKKIENIALCITISFLFYVLGSRRMFSRAPFSSAAAAAAASRTRKIPRFNDLLLPLLTRPQTAT